MGSMFDTPTYAKKLKKAGFTEEQAEVQAEALLEVIEANLASKSDIRELDHKIDEVRRDLNLKIEEVCKEIGKTRKDLNQRIEEASYKLTIRLGGIMVAGITLLAILIKLL